MVEPNIYIPNKFSVLLDIMAFSVSYQRDWGIPKLCIDCPRNVNPIRRGGKYQTTNSPCSIREHDVESVNPCRDGDTSWCEDRCGFRDFSDLRGLEVLWREHSSADLIGCVHRSPFTALSSRPLYSLVFLFNQFSC